MAACTMMSRYDGVLFVVSWTAAVSPYPAMQNGNLFMHYGGGTPRMNTARHAPPTANPMQLEWLEEDPDGGVTPATTNRMQLEWLADETNTDATTARRPVLQDKTKYTPIDSTDTADQSKATPPPFSSSCEYLSEETNNDVVQNKAMESNDNEKKQKEDANPSFEFLVTDTVRPDPSPPLVVIPPLPKRYPFVKTPLVTALRDHNPKRNMQRSCASLGQLPHMHKHPWILLPSPLPMRYHPMSHPLLTR